MKPEKHPSWFESVKDDLAKPLYAVTLKRNAPGTFDFGFIDEKKYRGNITYSPVNSTEGFWAITTDGFKVSGNAVQDRPITGIVGESEYHQLHPSSFYFLSLFLLPPPAKSSRFCLFLFI